MTLLPNLFRPIPTQPEAMVDRLAEPPLATHADPSPNDGELPVADDRLSRQRSGRTHVYSARVGAGFRGEVLRLQAQLQLERQSVEGNRARRVTDGEVLELMLEALKCARRNGESSGYAVSVADEVWLGVHELARRMQQAPADVLEQLVADKLDELGLLPRMGV